MCRPKGSKDKTVRKKRSKWTRHDTVFVKQNWDKMSLQEIADALEKSKSCVRNNAKDIQSLRSKDFMSDVLKTLDITRDEKVSGLYGIVTHDSRKVYIGSSHNVIERLNIHYKKIMDGTHENSVLAKLDHSKIYFVLFSECEDLLLMECEARLIRKYSPQILLNKTIPQDLENMKLFLDKSIARNVLDRYTITDRNCWEWTGKLNKSGYGRIQTSIKGQTKDITIHRLMYYHKTGEYPGLVRHMCHNRKCMNPDHLQAGSSRDNSLDSAKVLAEEFEKKYVEFKGDRIALTEHFGWTPNKKLGYSPQIIYHVRKLGLKKKYPELIPERPKPRKRAKKPSAKKAKIAMFGRRGPKKKRYLNETVDCWKCIEDYVEDKKHRWICMECGRKWVSTRSNVKMSRGCKTCRSYPITEENPYVPTEDSYITKCGGVL